MVLNQAQWEALRNTRKKDQKTLTIIYQVIDDTKSLRKIYWATTVKQTWKNLENTCKEVDWVKKARLKNLSGD